MTSLDPCQVAAMLAGAEQRRTQSARRDDPNEIHARLAALRQEQDAMTGTATDTEHRTAWEMANAPVIADWETLLRPHFGIPDAAVLARQIAAVADRHGLHGDGRWCPECETYEVLVGDTVYEECDTLGQVTRAVVNAFDEIRADELIGDVRTRRISRHLRAENDPS